VPPENKPTPAEITTCRDFLTAAIAEMPRLCAIVALGRIAHETVVVANGARRSQLPFGHGRTHSLGAAKLFDSYHCSRYNTNTGVLTPQMFRDVFAQVREHLGAKRRLGLSEDRAFVIAGAHLAAREDAVLLDPLEGFLKGLL